MTMTSKQNWIVGSSSSAVHAATPEVVYAYEKVGLGAMEISLPWDQYDTVDFPALKKASDETGVQLWSLHLPFDGQLSIAHAEKAVREKSVKMNLELMKKAADVGITHSVIHPGTEPTLPSDRAERLKESAENLHLLAEAGLKMGMTLCIEELPRTCPGNCAAEMQQLLAAHPALRSCFDTNHLLGESHEDYLNAVGSSIVTLHVSDYDFIDERHMLPGEGKVDWKAVMAHLESLGYNGPWMYEVSLEPAPNRRTGPVLSLEDLVENFKWLKTL